MALYHHVFGTLRTNQIWDLGTSVLLTDDISIEAALQLSPGQVIYADADIQVIVDDNGSLNAKGTAENPIIFEGVDPSRGFWVGFLILSNSSKNVFEHMKIAYAGGGDCSIHTDWNSSSLCVSGGARLKMSNSEITDSAAYAFYSNGIISGFSDNLIKNSAKTISIRPEAFSALTGTTKYFDNDEGFIEMRAQTGLGTNGTVNTSAQWLKQSVPVRIDGLVSLTEADLEIAPGSVFEFTENSGIQINEGASLNASGNASQTIEFRGTDSARGFWKGLGFKSVSSKNVLESVVLSGGGSNAWNGHGDRGGVYVYGLLKISDTKLSNNAGSGLVVAGGNLSLCDNVELFDNEKGDGPDAPQMCQ